MTRCTKMPIDAFQRPPSNVQDRALFFIPSGKITKSFVPNVDCVVYSTVVIRLEGLTLSSIVAVEMKALLYGWREASDTAPLAVRPLAALS